MDGDRGALAERAAGEELSVKPRGIIVIEGADAAGKTTLARYFVENFGARYLHSTVRRDIWRWHLGALRLAVKLADEHLVILDRHWLSEQAYGQAYRGGPAYDLGARCFDRVMQKHGAVTVLCVPSDLKRQLARHAEGKKVMIRGRDGVMRQAPPEYFINVERVARLYYDLAQGNLAHPGTTYLDQLIQFGDYLTRHDVVRYDIDRLTERDLPRTVRGILEQLSLCRERAGFTAGQFENLAGSLATARYLFVGAEISPKIRPTQPAWPFFWNDQMSAATYLNGVLHRMKFDETRAVWMNARPRDWDDGQIMDVLDAAPHLRVIALGSMASSYLSVLGVAAIEVPHPQWWRRFRFNDADGYAKLLEGAMR